MLKCSSKCHYINIPRVCGLETIHFIYIYILKKLQGYLCKLHFKIIHCFKAMYLFFIKYDLHEYLLVDIILTKYTHDITLTNCHAANTVSYEEIEYI